MVAEFFHVSPQAVYDWPTIDFEDAVEYIHLTREFRRRQEARIVDGD